MGKGSYRLRLLFTAIIFLSAKNLFALSEDESFKELLKLSESGKNEELVTSSGKFLKDFPKSGLIADVRFILAENERDPKKAIDAYKILVDKYAYFKKRDAAQHKICEILYLEAKWNDLVLESSKGIRLFKSSGFYSGFQFFLTKALINIADFESAKKICVEIMKNDHNYDSLSEALLLLAHINKNIYGYSKSYLYTLNEIITGFDKSPGMITALYLLGRYYENKLEYDKAYSAYLYVTEGFPNSSEAGLSKRSIEGIASHNPVKTNYMPDADSFKKAEGIDIEPETDIAENNKSGDNKIQYSISLGPFNNIKSAREIKALIDKDFQPVEIAEIKNGFSIYAGRFPDADSAIKTKIRLAEEFGINGNIVKIIKDSDRLYIYEE